jgi:eukaryotic-like serine/threonine-protein kinase
MNESTKDRHPFERLAEEFAERIRRGEHPSLTEYVERFPEHADDIRDLFPALALVEKFKPVRHDGDVSLVASVQAAHGNLPEQLGDYRILRYLGEGGMGVVYEAVRESLRSHVALKVMHPQYRNRPNYLRRFHTEARSAARLHHTNIVSVFDYGEHDGICYYAMQFVPGQSLDKVLDDIRQLRREKEGLDAGNAITLACQMESRLADSDVSLYDQGVCATSSQRKTVTLGLLTGRFATASADVSLGEAAPLRPSATAVGAVAEVASMGAATRGLLSDLRQAESSDTPPNEPSPSSGKGPDSESLPPQDTTSSLIGKADVRYYREVARLGAQVADALAYAHKRGVLHRDIKPPNLILDSLGNVWITDFGLAKFEDGDDLSQSHDLVGTLRFMAPERFRGVSDRRGDLYSLGATLYELLTFRPAFEGKDQLDLIHRVENDQPSPLRQLDRKIPRDLETIVLKSLAKDPNHRFGSAEEMAAELRRFVENRPIRSRPLPYYQQFWRWCKRNPWLATANVSAAALTTILAVVSTVAAWSYHKHLIALRFEKEKTERALQSAADAERQTQLRALDAFHSKLNEAKARRYSRQMGQRFGGLEDLAEAAATARELKLPRERFDTLRNEAIACMALPDLKPTGRVTTLPAGVIAWAFDSTMIRYALRFRDGTIQVRRVADDGEVARFSGRGERENYIVLSPDGRYLAATHYPGRELTVWDIERGTTVLNDPGSVTWGAKFSPDSRRVAVGHVHGEVVIYDLPSGRTGKWMRLPAKLIDLAFRPDGTQFAVLTNEAKNCVCSIFEAETGTVLRSITLARDGLVSIAWSSDGSAFATPCDDRKIYVWDAVTGARRAVLEGHTNIGLACAFDPSGAVLASNGWEGRLLVWDPVLGRQWLKLTGYGCDFARDGRFVVMSENKLITYEINAALEYRTVARAPSPPLDYFRVSIHRDGRLLALGTNGGVVLWDLARGTELAFMQIGLAWHSTFEPSGDLLTNSALGVWRWPVKSGSDHMEYHIGPPEQLALAGSDCLIDCDHSGRIVAVADHSEARVMTTDRLFRVGPLDDCRSVAVSPDGEWLATGVHNVSGGVMVWRIRDGTKEKQLPFDHGTGVAFSPDGKWLLTGISPCRLWSVETWEEARQIGGQGLCFSPDGGQLVVQEADATLRLVETETGRTLARLESPDASASGSTTFTPDGTRLVFSANQGPAVHVWDLRAIRKRLAAMGLDWDAPAYPEDDPYARSAAALPTLNVDYGKLAGHLTGMNEAPEKRIQSNTARLKQNPEDANAYHLRGHALVEVNRLSEGIDDFSEAIRLRPDDVHLLAIRGSIHQALKQYELAIADMEAALARQADQPPVRERLAQCCNNLAWYLANRLVPQRDLERALAFSQRAVELNPAQAMFVNSLGVVQYRAGRFADAIDTLERSLAAGRGQADGFDLFFLALSHHRQGQRAEARACFDRAVRRVRLQKNLSKQHLDELAAFRVEAEHALAGPPSVLPVDVFAPD